MEIKELKITEIQPYYNNPRNNSRAIKPTAESIRRFGFTKPILVDKNNIIIAGHTRYEAAIQLGLQKVPVVVSDMEEEKVKLFRIADNKLAERSFFDESTLIEELKSFESPIDLQDFFFENISELLGDINFTPNNTSIDFVNVENFKNEECNNSNYTGVNLDLYDNQPKDEICEKNEQIMLRKPFEVYDENGKKVMETICPFCGNKEKIVLDEKNS